MVFAPASSDSRNNYCAAKIAATIGDGAQDADKRTAEAFPHAMTLTFRLDGLGGFNFGGVKQAANVTRLPWGGSGSELVAFVRGPLLVNRVYNEERLTHFQQRVLTPHLRFSNLRTWFNRSSNPPRTVLIRILYTFS